jgi:YHS domain-containing protein
MWVDEPRAVGRSEYQNQTYYFCSAGCKQKFDHNPQQYVGRQANPQDADRKTP